MYQVPYLLQEAQKALQPEVDITTCCTTPVVAWHHNAKELEDFCWRFVKAAHASKISTDQLDLLRMHAELNEKLETI